MVIMINIILFSISFAYLAMTSSRPKLIAGPEFMGRDELNFTDIQDWVVQGFGDATKQQLDEFEWDGEAVATIGLSLSADNRKVMGGKLHLVGELMKSTKEFRANKLFERAEKDL